MHKKSANEELCRRRTSHEVRGLKLHAGWLSVINILSHLTRGAWIEIIPKGEKGEKGNSRTSHEVRGLKF